MTKLAIYGAGGHARVVADAAHCSGRWNEILLYDENWSAVKKSGAWQVVGGREALLDALHEYAGVIVALGDNVGRAESISLLEANGARLTSIIHPSATICENVVIEAGCAIFAGAVINIGAVLGKGCIINTGSTVDHDCQLGSCVHLSPGVNLAGSVTIGDNCWLGIGACVIQNITIGKDVVVGAGAAVITSIPDNKKFAGVPARMID